MHPHPDADTELHRSVFAGDVFPGRPFMDPTWTGIAFDREKYDHTRMPTTALRAFLEVATAASSSNVSVRGLGLNFCPSTAGVGYKRLDLSVDRYLQLVFDPDSYSPEYQIAESSGAWAMWLHWEWSVVGGPVELISSVVQALGGQELVWSETLKEFGLDHEPLDQQLLQYLQTLTGRGASAA